MSYTKNH